ncbi:hypothetical protein ACWDR9_35770, partial [Streptosporangium sandarakinum]
MAYDRPSGCSFAAGVRSPAQIAKTTGSGVSRRVVTSVATRTPSAAKTAQAPFPSPVRVRDDSRDRPARVRDAAAAATRAAAALYYCSPDEVVFLTTRDAYEPHYVDDRK